jgi:CO/xanthine dehydrogenase FAD-binding subunit
MYYKSYHQALTLDEAIRIYSKTSNPKYIAGGTDLMVQLRERQGALFSLIDISRISELKDIRIDGSEIEVGAAVTFQEIIDSPLLKNEAPLLVHASQQTGAAQIQHMGTIGGNIANASPAGDTLPSLYILGTNLVLSGEDGDRRIPISEFILGVRKTALRPGEIIKKVCFERLPDGSGSAFLKYGLRECQAISVVSVASIIEVQQGKILTSRIALGAVAPTIVRCPEAEQYLFGKSPSSEIFEQAGKIAQESANPIGDIRGSAAFRRYLIKPLTKQCLDNAWQQFTLKQ